MLELVGFHVGHNFDTSEHYISVCRATLHITTIIMQTLNKYAFQNPNYSHAEKSCFIPRSCITYNLRGMTLRPLRATGIREGQIGVAQNQVN